MSQKDDVELIKQVAGRPAGYVTEGDIVTHAVPIDPTLEEAKAFVSGIAPAGNPQPQIAVDDRVPRGYGPVPAEMLQGGYARQSTTWGSEYDAVNPPHYQRGPVLHLDVGEQITRGISRFKHTVTCIEVMRAIKDPRLATAFKYIWRVAFGGKCEPGMEQATQRERDERDINSAVWYLQDWLNHEV